MTKISPRIRTPLPALAIALPLACIALGLSLVGCEENTPMTDNLPPQTPSPTTIEDLRSGVYLNTVLNGDYTNPLTIAGAMAIEAALTDAEVEAALTADWHRPLPDLMVETPAVRAMLHALAPVYDSHFAPESVSLDNLRRESDARDNLQPEFSARLRPAALPAILIGGATVLVILNATAISDLVDCTFDAVERAFDESQGGGIPEAILGCLKSATEASPLLGVADKLASWDPSISRKEVLAATGLTALSRLVDRVRKGITDLVEQEPTTEPTSSSGGSPGTTETVPNIAYRSGTVNKKVGIVTLGTGRQPGETVQIEVSVRDHACEDGDRVSILIRRDNSWEEVFNGEIFNTWQTRSFDATVGYHYTILAHALNGTGFKGFCSHVDLNSGEMSVGYNGLVESASSWEAPGGDSSAGVINITP